MRSFARGAGSAQAITSAWRMRGPRIRAQEASAEGPEKSPSARARVTGSFLMGRVYSLSTDRKPSRGFLILFFQSWFHRHLRQQDVEDLPLHRHDLGIGEIRHHGEDGAGLGI